MKNKNEILSHFPKKVSKAFVDYTMETALLSSRYLFVWRKGKAQMAYCTHCHEEYQIGEGKSYVKHNEKATCLRCLSECIVKSRGRGHSHLIDGAYVVWYEKSVVDPKAIVARWLYVIRDYREDYRNIETKFTTDALYLFKYGHGGKMLRPDYEENWREKSKVNSLTVGTYWYPAEVYVSEENVKEAVHGTPFQYSMWQEYERESYNFLRFFDTFAKYPSIEYITKLGLRGLVSAKLNGNKTYGSVYWRGKSIDKVLRMSKSEIRDLRQVADKIEPKSLYSFHFWRNQGWNVTPSEGHFLRNLADKGYYFDMLKEAYEAHGITLLESAKYLLKQAKRADVPTRYSDITYALTEWRDYIRDCLELGIDTKQKHVLFPNNLHKIHDKMMRRVKIKKDEHINQLIQERLPGLNKFAFTSDEFLIRPAISSIELFEEGKALNHCVGGYSNRYASGETMIFLVRRVSEISVPFCTVEVNKDKIVQARGFENCSPGKDVQIFLEAFIKNMRLVKKQVKKARAA